MKTESEAQKAAQAFWELAEGKDTLKLEAELEETAKALSSLPELKEALISRKIPPEKKLQVFSKAFRDKVSGLTFGFLVLLIESGLIENLPSIVKEFSQIRYKKENKLTAEVITAQSLDNDLKNRILSVLSEATGKEIALKCRVDESILGGIVIRVGDRIIDGSLKGRLNEARLTFASRE